MWSLRFKRKKPDPAITDAITALTAATDERAKWELRGDSLVTKQSGYIATVYNEALTQAASASGLETSDIHMRVVGNGRPLPDYVVSSPENSLYNTEISIPLELASNHKFLKQLDTRKGKLAAIHNDKQAAFFAYYQDGQRERSFVEAEEARKQAISQEKISDNTSIASPATVGSQRLA